MQKKRVSLSSKCPTLIWFGWWLLLYLLSLLYIMHLPKSNMQIPHKKLLIEKFLVCVGVILCVWVGYFYSLFYLLFSSEFSIFSKFKLSKFTYFLCSPVMPVWHPSFLLLLDMILATTLHWGFKLEIMRKIFFDFHVLSWKYCHHLQDRAFPNKDWKVQVSRFWSIYYYCLLLSCVAKFAYLNHGRYTL